MIIGEHLISVVACHVIHPSVERVVIISMALLDDQRDPVIQLLGTSFQKTSSR